MMYRVRRVLVVIPLLCIFAVCAAFADDTMSKDQWQQELNQYTAQRNTLSASVKTLTDQLAALQKQSAGLDGDFAKCQQELYALVGSDTGKAAAFREQIAAAEGKANELLRLSDADLLSRGSEVKDLSANVKQLWENKLSLVPEFWDRLTALNADIKKLEGAIAAKGKMYTVRSWAEYRDCLWNISKSEEIYNNPWMWPKIWQDNREQIHDPDLIYKGQKLRIPPAGEMSAQEKSAAKSYYARKEGKHSSRQMAKK